MWRVLLLLFVVSSPAFAATESWRWSVDGALYRIEFSEKNLTYKTRSVNFSFARRPCLEGMITQFRSRLLAFSEKEKKPAVYPKGYEPIFLWSPGEKKISRPVLRGTPFGLFLLGTQSEMEQIAFMEPRLCP